MFVVVVVLVLFAIAARWRVVMLVDDASFGRAEDELVSVWKTEAEGGGKRDIMLTSESM